MNVGELLEQLILVAAVQSWRRGSTIADGIGRPMTQTDDRRVRAFVRQVTGDEIGFFRPMPEWVWCVGYGTDLAADLRVKRP